MPITTDVAGSIQDTDDVNAATLAAVDSIIDQVVAAYGRCAALVGNSGLAPLGECLSAIKSEREAIAAAVEANVPEA